MRWTLAALWFVFAGVFFWLGHAHWVEARAETPPFELTVRPMNRPGSPIHAEVGVAGMDVDQPIKDFVRDFNAYLDEQNRASERVNRLAACGYFVAALTALVSMAVELKQAVRSARSRAA